MLSDYGAAYRPRQNPEEQLQRAIIGHLGYRLMPNVIYYHCPNGGQRSKSGAARLKGMGVVPGVPDLCFVLADGSAAFMELKAGKGKQSPAQLQFQARCEAMGVPYVLTSSIDTALAVLEGWGVIKKEAI